MTMEAGRFGDSAILLAGAMPRGPRRLCIQEEDPLAELVPDNVVRAGLEGRVRVVADCMEVSVSPG